jgi:DNA-binding NtrC family response regulator
VLNSGGIIRLEDLPPRLSEVVGAAAPAKTNGAAVSAPITRSGRLPTLAEVEHDYLVRVLQETRGNKKRAAEIMKVDRKTLSRMVERHKVDVEEIKQS